MGVLSSVCVEGWVVWVCYLVCVCGGVGVSVTHLHDHSHEYDYGGLHITHQVGVGRSNVAYPTHGVGFLLEPPSGLGSYWSLPQAWIPGFLLEPPSGLGSYWSLPQAWVPIGASLRPYTKDRGLGMRAGWLLNAWR